MQLYRVPQFVCLHDNMRSLSTERVNNRSRTKEEMSLLHHLRNGLREREKKKRGKTREVQGMERCKIGRDTVEVGSLHTLRLESLKLVFQPLHKL